MPGTQPPEGPRRLGYTHREAAELLSISERMLFKEVKAGRIRRSKAGTKNIFPLEELERYLRDNLQ